MTLTKSELEALIALAQKATPGEWHTEPFGGAFAAFAGNSRIGYFYAGFEDRTPAEAKANCDLATRARTALPLYAKQLMEAMAELERCHAGCDYCCGHRLCSTGRFIAAYHAQEKPENK